MTLLIVSGALLLLIIAGAPFVPAHKTDLDNLFDELGSGSKKVFVDLGSGDGRVLTAARDHGFTPVGYELNPILWVASMVRLRSTSAIRLWPWQLANLQGASVIYIFSTSLHLKNLKRSRFPDDATIVIYGPQPMSWSRQNATTVGSSVVYPQVAQNTENKLP